MTYLVGFRAPYDGMDARFNTFRMGTKFTKRLKEGDSVLLFDTLEERVFGVAKVLGIDLGTLAEMLEKYAHENHTQLATPREAAVDGLREVMLRMYGPHIAKLEKRATVLTLQRIPYR